MALATVDGDQLRALQALRRVFGADQVTVVAVRESEPKGTTSPPRYPDRPPDRPRP